MPTANLTLNGFYTRSVEADYIEGEGTFTPLPDYNPKTEIPKFVGLSWIVVSLSVRDEYIPPSPEPQPYYIPTYLLRQRAEKIGIWSDLSDYLVQYPALMLKTLTLQTGVDPNDADLIDGLTSLQVPQSVQDYLLSDPSLGV